MSESVRINKYLSNRGICSRRKADELVLSGRIRINGAPAMPGMKVSQGDRVLVDGKALETKTLPEKVVLAFNKPRGIVCTDSEKDRAENIIDHIGYKDRIFSIGRLDKDSEGLILLTNRGELVNLVNKAAGVHEKEYLVSCSRPVTDDFLRKMSQGVLIEVPFRDGTLRRIKTARCPVKRKNSFSFYITLTEGYNREIRRMCRALKNRVDTIKRIRVMNIRLGTLKEGKFRIVEGAELKKFEKELGL